MWVFDRRGLAVYDSYSFYLTRQRSKERGEKKIRKDLLEN